MCGTSTTGRSHSTSKFWQEPCARCCTAKESLRRGTPRCRGSSGSTVWPLIDSLRRFGDVNARMLSVLKYTAAAVDAVTPRRRGVTVLAYHRVGANSGLQVDLDEQVFDAQMAVLASERRAIAIDDGLELLASSEPPATDPLVVTFDDGTADWIDAILPILARRRVPATF